MGSGDLHTFNYGIHTILTVYTIHTHAPNVTSAHQKIPDIYPGREDSEYLVYLYENRFGDTAQDSKSNHP